MNPDRLFLDTAFIQALLNPRDNYHLKAKHLFPRVKVAREVWLTEAIIVEIGNALSALDREGTVKFIHQCYQTSNIGIVQIDSMLLAEAISLYQSRPDKTWGLTDCLSFVVMAQKNLTDAVTSDRHFIQAGFQALMLS